MAQNISILEGGTAQQFGQVNKLKISNSGGGTSLWVPDDEVNTKSLHVDSNGTYYASTDECYGYDEVSVNIVDECYGYDDDGNLWNVEVDDDDFLEETQAPSYIRVVTPPTKLDYIDGETIDTTGMVVMAYYADGTEYGDITDEVTIEPTEADVGKIKFIEYETPDAITVDGARINGKIYCQDRVGAAEYIGKTHPTDAEREFFESLQRNARFGKVKRTETVFMHSMSNEYLADFVVRPTRIAVLVFNNNVYAMVCAQSDGVLGVGYSNGGGSSAPHPQSFTYDGKTVWFYFTNIDVLEDIVSSDISISNITFGAGTYQTKANQEAVAWAMFYGISSISGGSQEITVKWTMMDDATELTDTFNIEVDAPLNS